MRLNPVTNAFFIAVALVEFAFGVYGLFLVTALAYFALAWLWEKLVEYNPIAAVYRWFQSTDW